ncbi:MAG: hypothetical protein K8H88_10850 [Sandaracinaceae bacterium]|nr:hypothetical protein [Sandaracinaceae bacterium]
MAWLTACATPYIDRSEEAAAAVRAQDLGELPYHPVALHLDLSIYAYQLYTQTLVWPFDPYYEDTGGGRDALMERAREWARETGPQQVAAGAGVDAFRGPGVLSGLEDNPTHDPIFYQYSRLHPWSSALANPDGQWVEYLTPSAITSQVDQAWICVRTMGSSRADHENGVDGTVTLYPLPARRDDAAPGARDVLMAFEGGTGDRGDPGQPASQSLMGFALARATQGDAYDIHIAFRGSRSGSAGRAFQQALTSGNPTGNPDWITDLGYRHEMRPVISAQEGHAVGRGMATSMASILPQVFYCLDQVVGRSRATAPANIYVTGHSLGGGLAQHFVSAVLLGSRYGPGGDLMPASLRAWPWAQLKLITFGAPRVGNAAWAEELTAEHLDSQPYQESIVPFDVAATGITDPEMLPRLIDPGRPAAYRVLIPSDPITTDLLPGGSHVGHTIYLEEGDALEILSNTDFAAHEPINERQLILETLRDDRIPEAAWAYHAMEALNPDREAARAGSVAEYQKLIAVVREYYVSRDLYFDRDAFDASLPTFFSLLEAE